MHYTKYWTLQTRGRQHEVELAKFMIAFWEEVLKTGPDPDKLYEIAAAIYHNSNIVYSCYEQMQEIYSNSVLALRSFAEFVCNMMYDEWKAKVLLDKANQLGYHSKTIRRDDNFRSTIFDDTVAVVIITGDHRNLGEIIRANQVVPKMFGIAGNNVIGHNVRILMPEPFSTNHEFIIRRNLSRGSGSVVDQRRRVVILHRSGFISDAVIYVKMFVQNMTSLSFLGAIDVVNESDIQIVTDQTGIITAISRTAMQSFLISLPEVDSRELNIRSIINDLDNRLKSYRIGLMRDSEYRYVFSQTFGQYKYTLGMTCESIPFFDELTGDIYRFSIVDIVRDPNNGVWKNGGQTPKQDEDSSQNKSLQSDGGNGGNSGDDEEGNGEEESNPDQDVESESPDDETSNNASAEGTDSSGEVHHGNHSSGESSGDTSGDKESHSSHEDDDRSDSENTFSEIEAESSSRDASTSVRPSAMSRSSWWLHSRSRGRQNSDASSRTSIKDIINPHGESHEERQSDLKRAMTLSDISSVANSAATRSSAQSTLLRDESNRQQEQVILFRLKKSSLLALILVCAIELSSMAMERSMKQNHSLVMDRVIKSGSRGM